MFENESVLQDKSNILLGENQLQKYGRFLFTYTKNLLDLEDTRFIYPNNNKYEYINIELLSDCGNNDEQDEEEEMYTKNTIINLVSTENIIYNKIIITFTYLNKEINFIINKLKTKYFNLILYYGEKTEGSSSDSCLSISELLLDFQELMNLITYSYIILTEIMKQLNSLYYFEWNNNLICNNNIYLYDIFLSVGDLLMNYVILDEMISHQEVLNYDWVKYKDDVTNERQNSSNNKLKLLLKLLNEIENTLFTNKIFSNALQLKFNIDIKKNVKLSINILNYIKLNVNKYENKQLTELTYDDCLNFIKIIKLYIYYINIFGMNDKKLFKQTFDLFKKYTFVTLHSNIILFPDVFFIKYCNINVDKILDVKSINSINTIRDNYMLQAHDLLTKDVNIYNIYVINWVIKFDYLITKDISNMKLNEIKLLINILIDGINLSGKLKRILINIINYHYILNKPIVKNNIINLYRLIELLKYIKIIFKINFTKICKIYNKIINFVLYKILNLINNLKKSINNKNNNVDILTSLLLIEKLMKGSVTNDKLIIIKHALAFINRNIIKEHDINNLSNNINQLNCIYNIEKLINNNCNVSALYLQKNLLNIYIRNKNTNLNLKYLSYAINDICVTNNKEIKSYLDEIEQNIIKSFCNDIETNLRLHCHSHLQVDKLTLDKVTNNIVDNYNILINPELIIIINNYFNTKYKIENYLNKIFYDLTTIALHNYATYNEMRSIAQYKFKLKLINNNLPCKTLDNGTDILFIIRNIDSFINNYNYNINNQVFIENKSNNKFLNTINIYHISNNIRIYGIGIINTMINYIYQYLCKKLNLLIKYLYNENIKSKLIKEIKYYKENKIKLNQKYPFERAEKLLKVIKNINILDESESTHNQNDEYLNLNYLERFRIVITQIGNAIAFIRMIRSGSLHYNANSVQFLPNLNYKNIEEFINKEKLSDSTIQCLKVFDNIIQKSINNLQDSTDYFKLLINVFKPTLQNNNNIKYFYMLIPILNIYYIQYIIKLKEKIIKIKSNYIVNSNEVINFTDDGFIIGISYLIKIFNSEPDFNSLDWNNSVINKYENSIKQLNTTQNSNSIENLTLKTSKLYLNEFLLYNFNFNSIHIFFQNY